MILILVDVLGSDDCNQTLAQSLIFSIAMFDAYFDLITSLVFHQLQSHCWRCGEVFCTRCLDKQTPLPGHASHRPVPVCRSCYKEIRLSSSSITSTWKTRGIIYVFPSRCRRYLSFLFFPIPTVSMLFFFWFTTSMVSLFISTAVNRLRWFI